MKWTKSRRLQLNAVDLAVPYRETTVDQLMKANLSLPPILSPEILTLLVRPDCKDLEAFQGQYRRMLHCSTHPEKHYAHFTLYPERREIFAPKGELAQYQRWIYRSLLADLPLSKHAIAYRKGLSLSKALKPHVGRKYLVKMDISHFFDSITASAVYKVFEEFGYPKSVTTLLSKLCTLNGKLPQGVASSPSIANLVLRQFDADVGEWCHERGIAYTRYSDDLIFSANEMDAGALIRYVTERLAENGFCVNRAKTRVCGPGARHKALGIVLNDGENTDRRYRREIRQEMHFIRKYGVSEHLLRKNDPKFLKDGQPLPLKYLRALLGRIGWVLNITPDNLEFCGYKRYICDELSLYDEIIEHSWFETSDDYYNIDILAPEQLREFLEEYGDLPDCFIAPVSEEYIQESFW